MGKCQSKKEIKDPVTKFEKAHNIEDFLEVLQRLIYQSKEKMLNYPKETVINFLHAQLKSGINNRFGSIFGSLIGVVVVDGVVTVAKDRVIDIEYEKGFDTPIKSSVVECFEKQRARIVIGPMFENMDVNDINSSNVYLFGFSNALSFDYFLKTLLDFSNKNREIVEKNFKVINDSMEKMQNAYNLWINRDNKEQIDKFMKAYLENSIDVFSKFI